MNLSLFALWIFFHPAAGSFAVKLLPFIVLFVVLLVISIVLRRRNEALSQPTAASASGADDSRYWIAGLFYANPNNPALFVKKRFGYGSTLNFSHWASWLIMGALLSAPFLIQFMVGHPGHH